MLRLGPQMCGHIAAVFEPSPLSSYFKTRPMGGKRQHVGCFLDHLGRRLARAVAGAGTDPQKPWTRTEIRSLQGGRIFKAMCRHDAVVRFTCRHQDRRMSFCI